MRLWRKPRLDDKGIFHLRFAHRGTIGNRWHELTLIRAPTFVSALILRVDEKNLSIETNAALTDALTYDYLLGTLTRFRNYISRNKGRGLFELNVMKIGWRAKPRLWQKQIVETPSSWFDTIPGFVPTRTRLQCSVVVQKIIKSELKWSVKKKVKKINTVNSTRT